MLLKPETAKIQQELAEYCRTGKLTAIKGSKPERLPTYRRLVYNVIKGSLEQAYPIVSSVLTGKEWENAVGGFFTDYKAVSNQVWQMPKEFLNYLSNLEFPVHEKHPYLLDLLHFEWMEIEVFCMEDNQVSDGINSEWSYQDQLVFNPDHRIIELNYPVHKTAVKDIEGKGRFALCVFRHRETFQVHFMEVSPFFASLINLQCQNSDNLEDALQILSKDYDFSLNDESRKQVTNFLMHCKQKGLLLGSISLKH